MVDVPLAVPAVLVGRVEHRQVLVRQVRRPFDGLAAADVVVGLLDLLPGETQSRQQVEIEAPVLLGLEPEPLESLLAQGVGVEGVTELEDAREAPLQLGDLLGCQALAGK